MLFLFSEPSDGTTEHRHSLSSIQIHFACHSPNAAITFQNLVIDESFPPSASGPFNPLATGTTMGTTPQEPRYCGNDDGVLGCWMESVRSMHQHSTKYQSRSEERFIVQRRNGDDYDVEGWSKIISFIVCFTDSLKDLSEWCPFIW